MELIECLQMFIEYLTANRSCDLLRWIFLSKKKKVHHSEIVLALHQTRLKMYLIFS